ncbi:hypothetical protein GSI_12336 [Ganoderma sinense ZZ0214-1]|uniref:F-box domain-containing protein n=1 Tax=Ganoderma sinense ZZ0214-1 TaxID=1077348 RepID=A0A2G8RZ33_9APHY|nr:hypothetical protein GSI_12336 [Ganoderma sinense ZZ0214-1]
MFEKQVADAFGLVLAKRKSIEKLTIAFDGQQAAAVEAFVKAIGAEVTLLSLLPNNSLDKVRWDFAQDSFPRLDRLVLSCVIPVPVPGASLLSLTHLYLHDVLESFSDVDRSEKPWTFAHRFLAACPNLETLRTVDSFEYPLEYLDLHNDYDDLPVVTLPRLHHLSVEGQALDTSTALGTLRLPTLSTFDITAFPGRDPYDCDFYVIPQNVSESLPPIRRSRSLSFIAGGRANDLSLRGGPGPGPNSTFSNDSESDCQWSITLPDLAATHARSDLLGLPCCIRYTCARFLARLPHLVVPSILVRLELHVADGLPIPALGDLARFFEDMTRLRTLVIGSDKLIARVLEAFEAEAESRVCPQLEELELCLGEGPTRAEVGPLVEFVARTVGAWVRGGGMKLQTLTLLVRMGSDADGEDLGPRSGSDAAPDVVVDVVGQRGGFQVDDGAGSAHDSELAYLKLWCDLSATLKSEGSESVGEVRLKMVDCAACNVEYKPVDSVEFDDGVLSEDVTYY